MSMKPVRAQAPWAAANWEIATRPHPLCCRGVEVELEGRQRLFEKALTPSDVGKLNRLVIPKQHAEKHFPLDGESGEKGGLLLSFEDEAGKPWRFRYSYWGSSQSYVLTKGWSRFVKEKKLDAGDVVCFDRLRGCGGSDRLSISCHRRRCEGANESPPPPPATGDAAAPGGHTCYVVTPAKTPSSPSPCLAHAVSSKANAPTQSKRRLRLFGVNLDCTLETTAAAGPEQKQEPVVPAINSSTADQSQYEI